MTDNIKTQREINMISFKYNDADALISTLPQEEELSVHELAIHRRAYISGVYQGERQAKEKIVHNFQMAMIGHVL